MAQKIGQAILTGTGIAGLISAGALVFNNNKKLFLMKECMLN
jgi:multidrug transporter EmrE-like cation transporter